MGPDGEHADAGLADNEADATVFEVDLMGDPVGLGADGAGPASRRPGRREVAAALVGVVTLVLAGAFLAPSSDTSSPRAVVERPPGPSPAPQATAVAPPSPTLLTPLPAVAELAGPIVLAVGNKPGFGLELDGTGVVSSVERSAEPEPFDLPPGTTVEGYPIATVAEGLLVIPNVTSLGALTYWTPTGGLELPVPSEPLQTSFMAAAGDVAVLRSGADLVGLDLRKRAELMRVGGDLGGSTVVRACLSPDQRQVALVTDAGRGVVIETISGEKVLEFETALANGGVAWSATGQLIHLETSTDRTFIRATDVDSAASRLVASFDGRPGAQLSPTGRGC